MFFEVLLIIIACISSPSLLVCKPLKYGFQSYHSNEIAVAKVDSGLLLLDPMEMTQSLTESQNKGAFQNLFCA